jgi:hypothetical protein
MLCSGGTLCFAPEEHYALLRRSIMFIASHQLPAFALRQECHVARVNAHAAPTERNFLPDQIYKHIAPQEQEHVSPLEQNLNSYSR